MYNPPFEVTDEINSLINEITALLDKATSVVEDNKNPTLRRTNHIKTVYGSLAIEQNTLTFEQVTAVINGKRVLAPPKDIAEVKNAFEIYDCLDTLNPCSVDDILKAHSVMMRGLVDECGEFRTKQVGVVDANSSKVIHFGTLPAYVEQNVYSLVEWLGKTDVHPLIKSGVFHYEFELIHPFLDGNGRVGRLWHTLILSKWMPIFAWLPIESIVYEHQEEYYNVINECNDNASSTEFILFMLKMIKQALLEVE